MVEAWMGRRGLPPVAPGPAPLSAAGGGAAVPPARGRALRLGSGLRSWTPWRCWAPGCSPRHSCAGPMQSPASRSGDSRGKPRSPPSCSRGSAKDALLGACPRAHDSPAPRAERPSAGADMGRAPQVQEPARQRRAGCQPRCVPRAMAASRALEVTVGPTASLKEGNGSSSKADPYAVLRLGDVECRTGAEALPGARPVWNHRFTFLLPRDPCADPADLHVDVRDSSAGQEVLLGSCHVSLLRVFKRRSLDVVQPVHRKCGRLVGHLRLHLVVLQGDAPAGPDTAPAAPQLPPVTPLQGEADPATPESSASAVRRSVDSGEATADLTASRSPPTSAGRQEEGSHDREEGQSDDAASAMRSANDSAGGAGPHGSEKASLPRDYQAQRTPSESGGDSAGMQSLHGKKPWQMPSLLDAPTQGSPSGLEALECLMSLPFAEPMRPLASLAHAKGPSFSTKASPSAVARQPFPSLPAQVDGGKSIADVSTPGFLPFNISGAKVLRGAKSSGLSCLGTFAKSGSSRVPLRRDWDVAALASLSALVLAGPAAEPGNKSAEAESLVEALSMALQAEPTTPDLHCKPKSCRPQVGALPKLRSLDTDCRASSGVQGKRSGEETALSLFERVCTKKHRLATDAAAICSCLHFFGESA